MIHWLTTSPHPGVLEGWKRSHTNGYDAGQVGWRLHAVSEVAGDDVTQKYRPALCGLKPAHGWALDLFIDEPCARCQRAAEKRGMKLPELPK